MREDSLLRAVGSEWTAKACSGLSSATHGFKWRLGSHAARSRGFGRSGPDSSRAQRGRAILDLAPYWRVVPKMGVPSVRTVRL